VFHALTGETPVPLFGNTPKFLMPLWSSDPKIVHGVELPASANLFGRIGNGPKG
jgi:hypothetical protein